MTKKQILKFIFMLILGAILGGGATFALLKLADTGFLNRGTQISLFFYEHTLETYIILFVLLMTPTLVLQLKGKGLYYNSDTLTDDEMEIVEKKSSKFLDLAMTLNSMLLVLNFMLFGMLFKNTIDNQFVIIAIFLIGNIFSFVVEVTIIKFIKKMDERLKGDPTSMKFTKDFLESCDEAEKLKIYMTGYQAFQFSKFFALGLVVMTILLNMVFDTGGLSVFISCLFLLVQMLSYSYYALRSEIK